jgi:hypothetical protein
MMIMGPKPLPPELRIDIEMPRRTPANPRPGYRYKQIHIDEGTTAYLEVKKPRRSFWQWFTNRKPKIDDANPYAETRYSTPRSTEKYDRSINTNNVKVTR